MQDTMLSQYTIDLLKRYSGDEDDTLMHMYGDIKECRDRKKRKDLVQDYNLLVTEVNSQRNFICYKLMK